MSIHVDIITPEKQALSEEVDSLVVPAIDGELGVLAGHTPLLTRLGVGELRLKTGAQTRYLAISGGFLEVEEGNKVSVFAETAEMADDIDLERAKLDQEKAEARMTEAKDLTREELSKLEATLGRAILRIKMANRRNPPKPPSL